MRDFPCAIHQFELSCYLDDPSFSRRLDPLTGRCIDHVAAIAVLIVNCRLGFPDGDNDVVMLNVDRGSPTLGPQISDLSLRIGEFISQPGLTLDRGGSCSA